jgi:hypothetical protein
MKTNEIGGARLQGAAGGGGRAPPDRGLPAQRRRGVRADIAGPILLYNIYICMYVYIYNCVGYLRVCAII